jgi:preflagellin peptidase FlaK
LAVFIGLIASWSDFRESKIKNRLIIFGALAALFFYLAEILILLSFDISPRWVYFRDVLVNTGLGFLAGFILWRLNVWAPGDAKLFALFALLIPLTYYEKNYLLYFPSFALILNVFAVVLAFIFLKMICDFFVSAFSFFSRKQLPENSELSRLTDGKDGRMPVKSSRPVFKKVLKEFILMPAFTFGVFFALSVIFKSLQVWRGPGDLAFLDHPLLLFSALFMIFQVSNKIRRIFKMGLAFLFLIYLAAGLLLWPKAILTALHGTFRPQTIYFVLGFLVLNKLIDFYIEKKDVLKIPLRKLKPQMVLTTRSLGKLRGLAPDLEISPDGLTEEDLGIIKDLGEKNPKLRFVEIYKAMPLAPFIFLGVILTLILRGALVSLIL